MIAFAVRPSKNRLNESTRLAIGNKGEGCGHFPGVILYDVMNHEKLFTILQGVIQHIDKAYFKQDLIAEAGATNAFYLEQEPQKVGNCVMANSNSMEYALLNLGFESLLGPEHAKHFTRALKRVRASLMRLNEVGTYLDYHEISQNYPMDISLLERVYQKALNIRLRRGTDGF